MNAAANPFIDGFGEAGTFVWESGTVFDQAGVGYAVYHNSGNGGFELGSGKQAYIEGFKVGGKTGTAQKYENGHIAVGKYVSSFVGFFPADNPQYLALMLVDEPTGAHYGSTVAAPYAKMIFQQIINYKNLKPA